jgi:hypothetical protein
MSDSHIAHLSYVAVQALPPAEEIYQDAFGMAFPQVLAWCAAASGALLVVFFIKYLRG